MNNTSEGHPADLISIIKTKDLFDDDFQCQYLDIENLCELATANKFSVLSQNIRSLGGKFDHFREYVGRFGWACEQEPLVASVSVCFGGLCLLWHQFWSALTAPEWRLAEQTADRVDKRSQNQRINQILPHHHTVFLMKM